MSYKEIIAERLEARLNRFCDEQAQEKLGVETFDMAMSLWVDLPNNTAVGLDPSTFHEIELTEPRADFGWQTVFFEALQAGDEADMLKAISNIDDPGQLDEAIVLYKDWKSVQPVC